MKINWKKVWSDFDKWYKFRTYPEWRTQKKAIERFIIKNMERERKKK